MNKIHFNQVFSADHNDLNFFECFCEITCITHDPKKKCIVRIQFITFKICVIKNIYNNLKKIKELPSIQKKASKIFCVFL